MEHIAYGVLLLLFAIGLALAVLVWMHEATHGVSTAIVLVVLTVGASAYVASIAWHAAAH